MIQMRYVDHVVRQADALQRLWGGGAPQVAQRYLATAQRLKRTAQIEFWEQVVAAVAKPAARAAPSGCLPVILTAIRWGTRRQPCGSGQSAFQVHGPHTGRLRRRDHEPDQEVPV